MRNASKTPRSGTPDASALFADIQRRKRPVQERPPDLLIPRLEAGAILGILMGATFGFAESYLSGAWVEQPVVNVVVSALAGLLLGVVNAYPTSSITGSSWASLTYALFVIARFFVTRCGPYYFYWLNGVWVVVITLGLVVGLFLAALIPFSVLRWSTTEQREYFDRPWSGMERLRPVLLMMLAAGFAGWVIPFLLAMMGLGCG